MLGGQTPIPRLDCLGLIEASSSSRDCLNGRTIPRLDCLGLIEADGTAYTSGPPQRFRGLIASASLKPSFNGQALIVNSRFRGLIASASLKPLMAVLDGPAPSFDSEA